MPSALRIKEIRDLEDNVMMQNGALTGNVSFPAGHILQVKSFSLNEAFTVTDTPLYPGLDVTITPTSTNNQIVGFVSIGPSTAKVASGSSMGVYVYRENSDLTSTQVFKGTNFMFGETADGRMAWAGNFNDFPNTIAQIRYRVYVSSRLDDTVSCAINDTTSTITVMEVQV